MPDDVVYVVSEHGPALAGELLAGDDAPAFSEDDAASANADAGMDDHGERISGDSRKRRRWPWVAGAGIVAGGAAAASLMILPSHASAQLSPACQRAVTAQNVFVEAAIAEGYGTTMPAGDTLAKLSQDMKLLADARKAGCPAGTQVEQLP